MSHSQGKNYILYIANHTCSQSAQIIAKEVFAKVEGTVKIRHVDVPSHLFKETHETEYNPSNDYFKVNPKGYVPFLVLPTGETLSETLAVTTYLADLAPELHLIEPQGSFARYKALEDLTFVATEIHQKYIPVFREYVNEDAKNQFREILIHNFGTFDQRLKAHAKKLLSAEELKVIDEKLEVGAEKLDEITKKLKDIYIYGERFATLDAYVFAVYDWSIRTHVDLSSLLHLKLFIARVGQRPSVKAALAEELANFVLPKQK